MPKKLTKVFGTVVRTVNNRLTYVELEKNPANKSVGLLFFDNCLQFPEKGDIKKETRGFQVNDKVEGYIDSLGTDALLKARVSDPKDYQDCGNKMPPKTTNNRKIPSA